jgi:hypothetical protein
LRALQDYSSRIYAKVKYETRRKIRSNATRIFSQGNTIWSELPFKMIPVALTDAIITGTEIGKKRIDSRTFLAFAVAAIAEKMVPTAVKPSVPRNIINPRGTRKGRTVMLYRIVKIKKVIISITVVNKNTPMSLARKIVQGLTGHRMRP